MNMIQELRERRIPQIVGGYVAGGWAVIQFCQFLEDRMAISPNLVNFVSLTLLFLLPSVVTLAWVHGRPGKDTWGRTPKVVVPTNLVVLVALLIFLFHGRDLGAVTQTIQVQDETGAVSERVVPKSEFRRRLLIYYPETAKPDSTDWSPEILAFLVTQDIGQDAFIDCELPITMASQFREAGSDDGHGLTRVIQRKIARDAHISHFLTGTISHRDSLWTLTTKLQDSESGREIETRTFATADLFTMADQVSRQVRDDLGIPAAHLAKSPDLPVSDLTSTDPVAIKNHVEGLVTAIQHNDWAGALPFLEDAVARDPHFALAQFMRYVVCQTLGKTEESSEAIKAAMANLYQLPERTAFMIKAQYYFNEKQDADKALAVLLMWSRIYPDDISAYDQQATFYFIRQDIPNTLAAYQKILEIDPSQAQYLVKIADLQGRLGHDDEAQQALQKYIDAYPSHPDGYQNLAKFLRVRGKLAQARDLLNQAQLLDPENLEVQLDIIGLDIRMGRYDQSRQALDAALQNATTDLDRAQVLNTQADLAELTGQTAVLIDRLKSYYQSFSKTRNPLQADLIYSMMLPAVIRTGGSQEALDQLDAFSVKIAAPFNKLIDMSRAWALADLGQIPAAGAALDSALVIVDAFKFETMRPTLELASGVVAEAAGNIDEAETHYRKALDITLRVEPLYQVRLAHILQLQGHDDEAVKILNKALKLQPAHPRANLELAVILEKKGKKDAAREHLKTAQAAWSNADPRFPFTAKAQELAARLQ